MIDFNTVVMLHGEDFNDSSLSPKSIVNGGATISEDGKFDKSFNFDGIDDYIQINEIDFNTSFTNGYTVEFYIYLSERNKSYPTVVSACNGTGNNNNRCFYIHTFADSTDFCFGDASGTQHSFKAQALDLNRWYHIAIVRKDKAHKLFIDGKLLHTLTLPSLFAGSDVKLYLGALIPSNTATFFKGKIDEFRVSNMPIWEKSFTPPAKPYSSNPKIELIKKNGEYINFSVTHWNINKVDILVNGDYKKTFNADFNNLKFDIDTRDLSYVQGNNTIKVKVTFNENSVHSQDIPYKVLLGNNASLKEVADKLEELSLQDFSNIDIVVKSELPSTKKEGQLVIICDDADKKIIASTSESDKENDSIFILLSPSKADYSYNISNKQHNIKLYIKSITSEDEQLESYLCVNGNWIQLTVGKAYFFKDGIYPSESTLGKFETTEGTITITADSKLQIAGAYRFSVKGTKTIDLSQYSKLEFDIDTNISNGSSYSFGVVSSNTNSYLSYINTKANHSGEKIVIDLESVNTLGRIAIEGSHSYGNGATVILNSISLS